MQVKELLKDYEFKKNASFDLLRPDVTIVLPTYSRAKSGFFSNCVNRILAQSFQNFELIIMDDASSDGTEDLIDAYIKKDPRVCSVRFGKRVGLPAISVNLGTELSRSQRLFYTFDDNTLTRDGLANLIEYQSRQKDRFVCYGKTNMHTPNGDVWLGGEAFDNNRLQYNNFISNGAILLDKRVFDDVGLYDPHIMAVRYCDWDLWKRMAKKYDFHNADIYVNDEMGLVQNDSLGNTYGSRIASSVEWTSRYRDDVLQFNNWRDYEVIQPPKDLSYPSQMFISHQMEKFSNHLDETVEIKNDPKTQGYVLVIFNSTASGELMFSSLPNQVIVDVAEPFFFLYLNEFIAGAKVIVFNRWIDREIQTLALAFHKYGIPYYYCLDDYLFSESLGQMTDDPSVRAILSFYKTTEVSRMLENAAGIFVSTHALGEKMEKFNKKIILLPCTTPYQLKVQHKFSIAHFKKDQTEPIKILYASEYSALPAFYRLRSVFIQISRALNRKIEIHVFCPTRKMAYVKDHFSGDEFSDIITYDTEASYIRFTNTILRIAPHFLIHVSNPSLVGSTDLYKYKTFNYLITAYLSNAIPIITLRPPYDALKEQEKGFADLIVENNDEMGKCMQEILCNPELAGQYLRAIEGYVQRSYPIEYNQNVLKNLLQENDALCDSLQPFFERERGVGISVRRAILRNINYLRSVLQIRTRFKRLIGYKE